MRAGPGRSAGTGVPGRVVRLPTGSAGTARSLLPASGTGPSRTGRSVRGGQVHRARARRAGLRTTPRTDSVRPPRPVVARRTYRAPGRGERGGVDPDDPPDPRGVRPGGGRAPALHRAHRGPDPPPR